MNRILKSALVFALVGALGVSLSGCSAKAQEAAADDAVAATVDDVVIPESRVQQELDRVLLTNPTAYDGEEGEAARLSDRTSIIDYLINQELVAKAAEDEGLEVTDEELAAEFDQVRAGYGTDEEWETALAEVGYTEQQLKDEIGRQLLTEKLGTAVTEEIYAKDPTDEELKAYYDGNLDLFTVEAGKRASHILFAPEDKATAESVLAELEAGADFAAKAKEHSIDDANAELGGDLGWATGDEYVDEFKAAFEKLAVGEMSQLVETEFGWHIILITDERAAEVTPFDDVKADIVADVQSSKAEAFFSEYMEKVRASCDIKVYDENGERIDEGTGTAAGKGEGE